MSADASADMLAERARCRRITELVFGGAAARAEATGENVLVQLLDSLMRIALRGIDSGKVVASINDVVSRPALDETVAQDRTKDRPRVVFETDIEEDGRWIAECPQLPGVLVYGPTPGEALVAALKLAQDVLHGEATQ